VCGRLRVGKSFLHVADWSVQPCVRPTSAVHMTAGHNALRGSGPWWRSRPQHQKRTNPNRRDWTRSGHRPASKPLRVPDVRISVSPQGGARFSSMAAAAAAVAIGCDAPPSGVKPIGTLLGSLLSPRGSLPEKSAPRLRPLLLRGPPTCARFPMGLHPVRRRCLVVRQRPTDVASGT
jgi:hypothetical protein